MDIRQVSLPRNLNQTKVSSRVGISKPATPTTRTNPTSVATPPATCQLDPEKASASSFFRPKTSRAADMAIMTRLMMNGHSPGSGFRGCQGPWPLTWPGMRRQERRWPRPRPRWRGTGVRGPFLIPFRGQLFGSQRFGSSSAIVGEGPFPAAAWLALPPEEASLFDAEITCRRPDRRRTSGSVPCTWPRWLTSPWRPGRRRSRPR